VGDADHLHFVTGILSGLRVILVLSLLSVGVVHNDGQKTDGEIRLEGLKVELVVTTKGVRVKGILPVFHEVVVSGVDLAGRTCQMTCQGGLAKNQGMPLMMMTFFIEPPL
jgi:hypothetical protein